MLRAIHGKFALYAEVGHAHKAFEVRLSSTSVSSILEARSMTMSQQNNGTEKRRDVRGGSLPLLPWQRPARPPARQAEP